jgi:hypothetical protein
VPVEDEHGQASLMGTNDLPDDPDSSLGAAIAAERASLRCAKLRASGH